MMEVVFFARSREPVGDAPCESVEAAAFFCAHFGNESPALFVGVLEGFGEPDVHGAINERIAEKKKKDNGKKRNAHGAENHFCFDAGAEEAGAMFGNQADNVADEDESEDKECDHDERGERKENQEVIAILKANRRV